MTHRRRLLVLARSESEHFEGLRRPVRPVAGRGTGIRA